MDISTYIGQLGAKEIFEATGNIASILSLIISFLVWLGVKKIREFYIFNARFPDLTMKLSNLASNLSDGLNIYDGVTTKLKKILVDIEIILKSLRKHAIGDVKNSINSLIKIIQKTDSNNENAPKELLENIHLMTYKVIKQCEELYEESRWKR